MGKFAPSKWTKDLQSPVEGDLKVWWIPQVPGKPFEVPVASAEEGHRLCEVLAEYDLFQWRNRIKPDYSNAGGVCRFVDGEWEDVENDQDEDQP